MKQRITLPQRSLPATGSRKGPASQVGPRIRARRLDLGLTQAELAGRAGISASYLNLIEHGRRLIAGQRLADLARHLGTEPAWLSEQAPPWVLAALEPAPPGEQAADFAGRFPGWARRLAERQAEIAALEDRLAVVQNQMAHDPALAAGLHQIITSASAIQSTAAILVGGGLDADWQERFQRNVHDDSQRLAQASAALVAYLERLGEDGQPDARSEAADWLRGQGYHVAALEADAIDAVIDGLARPDVSRVLQSTRLSPEAAEAVAPWLALYARDARQLPQDQLVAALAAHGPDPAVLAAALGTPLAQLFRRLASLPPAPGRPDFGLAVCDGAGVVTSLKPVTGFTLPETGGCPMWPLYQALGAPGRPVRAVVSMPDSPALTAYAVAGPIGAGFDAVPVMQATMLVVPGTVPDSGGGMAPRPVGTTCNSCPRAGCAARRVPMRGGGTG